MKRRTFVAGTAMAALLGGSRFAIAEAAATSATPWRNWSGGVNANPAGRFTPASESELVAFLTKNTAAIRPVGAGHSFSPLVPTDGQILVLDRLSGMLDSDANSLTATFGGGTRLSDMGAPLWSVGQAMINLPDIDRQTLAGATSTATHGTGIDFKCLSGYVTALRLVTPAGEVLDLSATSDADLFDAARVGLGSLGVVTSMTLQNRLRYRLKQMSWVEKTDTLLQEFDQQAAQHRHFELFPLTHSDFSIALATDETDEPINNPPPSAEEEAALDMAMAGWMRVPPSLRRPLVNALVEQIGSSVRVDESFKILTNIRNTRFNEMEYSVPLEAGAECLQEVLRTISEQEIDVVFPLEYRYVSRDDTMLSMSSGDEDHAAISIHRIASEDYRPYFDQIEPIFWKYGGRPHWGKIHSLGAEQLAQLYPRFGEFQAIRQKMDPQGLLLNDHLRKVFGVRQ